MRSNTHLYAGPMMLILATTAGLATQAHAGSWKVFYTFSGTKSSNGQSSAWAPVVPNPPGLQPQTETGGGGGSSGGSASTIGHITLTCTWTPASGGEIIPKAALVPTLASALASYSGARPSSLQGRVYDGVNTVTVPVVSGSGSGNTTEQWSSNGRLLFPLSGGGEFSNVSKTWSFDVELSASFSYSSAANIGGPVRVMAYAPVDDTRTVSLSRENAHDERGPLIENGEWHTYGDSIYSAHRDDDGLVGDTLLLFNANYSSGWSNNKTVSWNSGGVGSTIMTTTDTHLGGYAKYGTPTVYDDANDELVYHGSPTGPQTFVISDSVTDTDGATAKAYYHLTLHDPVEPISADEGEAVSYSHYTIKSPAMDIDGPLVFDGYRAASTRETKIRIAHSTEVGLDLTATASIDLFKDLLGFTGEGHISFNRTVEVEREKVVPGISEDKFIYLIASQGFQRQHSRFYMYDAGGKIKRFVTQDSSGQTYPPFETYHEAIRDNALEPDYPWSDELDLNRDNTNNLPRTVEPEPLGNDYSGGAS